MISPVDGVHVQGDQLSPPDPCLEQEQDYGLISEVHQTLQQGSSLLHRDDFMCLLLAICLVSLQPLSDLCDGIAPNLPFKDEPLVER